MKNSEPRESAHYVAGMSEKELREKYDVTDIVKLGSNENPLGPSPKAAGAIQGLVSGLHRYPPMTDDSLREAVSQSLGRGITPDNLITGNGACDVLSMITNAFLAPGVECVICRPTFPAYEFLAKRNGADVRYADLDESSFAYNIDAVLAAVGERTRVVYLCSPNNPTGSFLSGSQLTKLLKGIPEHVLIVFDEAYHHFVTEEDRPDPVSDAADGRPLIAVYSFSKAFGLAGCRLGYGVAPPNIAEEVRRFRLPFHINNVTLEAGIAALGDSDHLDRTVKTVIESRSYLFDELLAMGVDAWPSQGNFVLFNTGDPADAVFEGLQRRGVIVRPMDTFYLPGYLRVSAGWKTDNDRFLDALRETLEELR